MKNSFVATVAGVLAGAAILLCAAPATAGVSVVIGVPPPIIVAPVPYIGPPVVYGGYGPVVQVGGPYYYGRGWHGRRYGHAGHGRHEGRHGSHR